MYDPLGDRMKERYENRTRYLLPRRTYTIVRIDGKAFHTWTRGLKQPFDDELIYCIDNTALTLCAEIQGSRFAFQQSDEISVLLTDFATSETDAWFDGNLQKIVSVAASIATAAFNECARNLFPAKSMAMFDARAFCIPDPVEAENYFIWRQQDAERNSLQSLCQYHFSQRDLHGKGRTEQHDMLHSVGVNWNDLPDRYKRGRCMVRENQGWKWEVPPVFSRERQYITSVVPRQWSDI